MNATDVNIHLHDDLKASVLWAAELNNVRCVAAVEIEGVNMFFERVAQIERLQAVLAEAADRLRELRAAVDSRIPEQAQ